MRIAYIILAHKNADQVVRLIRTLDEDSVHFFVHLDLRAGPELAEAIGHDLGHFPNVTFLDRRRIYWGDYSLVDATLRGMSEALASGGHFDYVINLSGQDYPLVSNAALQAFLEERRGLSFMRYFSLPHDGWPDGGMDRIRYRWLTFLGHSVPFFATKRFKYPAITPLWSALARLFPMERDFLPAMEPYGGSLWWCLSTDCAQFIIDYVANNKTYERFLKFCHNPDEIFFQTVIMQSSFREKVVNDNLRYIVWPSANIQNPKVLTLEDLDGAIGSDALFARKFDATVDSVVLDKLDEKIGNADRFHTPASEGILHPDIQHRQTRIVRRSQ